MKKLFIHAGIGLVLLVLLNQLAIRTAAVYKDGASIVCEKKREAVRKNVWKMPEEKDVVLYFGASGILSALIPRVFDSIMENRTYSLNLGLPALPIGTYFHYLLDFLENNPPPEYIVMTYHIDGEPVMLPDTYGNQGVCFPKEIFSYLLYSEDKNQIINFLLPLHVYNKYIFKYLYNKLFNPSDIEKIKKRNEKIIKSIIADRGFWFYFIKEESRFPEGRLPEDYKEYSDCPDCLKKIYDPEEDIFVDKFFNLIEKYDIEVFLVSHPVRIGSYKQFSSIPAPIKKLMNKYKNIAISPEGWKLPFYQNKYFVDHHHLNKDGAFVYTQKIAQEFNRIYKVDKVKTENKYGDK